MLCWLWLVFFLYRIEQKPRMGWYRLMGVPFFLPADDHIDRIWISRRLGKTLKIIFQPIYANPSQLGFVFFSRATVVCDKNIFKIPWVVPQPSPPSLAPLPSLTVTPKPSMWLDTRLSWFMVWLTKSSSHPFRLNSPGWNPRLDSLFHVISKYFVYCVYDD